jgi:hypothetical protein
MAKGFDSPDLPLEELLEHIRVGKIQLPDFQREWKWDDDRIKSLIASVVRGYPVGVLMMLEVGGEHTRFAPTPLAGVDRNSVIKPERLVLDGQQRLTSLFQSLKYGRPVETTDSRGKKISRWYYIDIDAAIDGATDLEDAIHSIPEDRVVRDQFGRNVVADYSTEDLEISQGWFPLRIVYDHSALTDWQLNYLTADAGVVAERVPRWKAFHERVIGNVVGYTVPTIVLNKETPRDAVCTVFEKVNTGGVVLNVFELLTATFAADGFSLKDNWTARKTALSKHRVLRDVESTDFLQVVTLMATRARKQRFVDEKRDGLAPGIGCRRKDILDLELEDYQDWAPKVERAFLWAAEFLTQESIFDSRDVPYRSQLVPLAAIRTTFGDNPPMYGARDRIARWYWGGVFGELYGGSTETRFARDLEQVPEWARNPGAPEPVTVTDASFREQRLLTLRTRNSAAYKGIYALLMHDQAKDWLERKIINHATFFDYQIDIHHIFPKAWCAKNEVADDLRESIVNKTAIARHTNILIGGRAPSEYMKTLATKADVDAAFVDSTIATHEIDPMLMRKDDFAGFFADRKDRLLSAIEKAMGKAVIREAPDLPGEEFEDQSEDDEPDNGMP